MEVFVVTFGSTTWTFDNLSDAIKAAPTMAHIVKTVLHTHIQP